MLTFYLGTKESTLFIFAHMLYCLLNISYAFHLQQTPLHVAASQGHCNIVEYLVMQGADVSIKDNDGVSITIILVMLVISI